MERADSILNYKDKTVYDNGVLINKLGIQDAELLDKVEREITSFKLAKLYLKEGHGYFNLRHFFSIHKYLFEDIYPFAGKPREEVISKRIPFCRPEYIIDELRKVLRRADIRYKLITNKEELVKFITDLYWNIDIIHPFREGNGRCEREFIRQYVKKIVDEQELDNFIIDYNIIDNKDDFINAVVMAEAMDDTSMLESMIDKAIVIDDSLSLDSGKRRK